MSGGHEWLFVYGTLKRGFGNHRLIGGARGVGAITVEKFAMSGRVIPMVYREPKLYQIRGEVYAVTPEQMEMCDRLEGHPHWYRREIVDVEAEWAGVGRAWIYLMDPSGMGGDGWYPSGFWPPEVTASSGF